MSITDITTRPLTKKLNKTIILIGGVSYQGKTTLCNSLMSDNTGYISLDELFKSDILGITEIKDFVNQHGKNASPNDFLIKKNIEQYMKVLISEINKIEKPVILIDGSTATSPFFRASINEYGKFNIWTMTKIKNVNH